MPHELAEARRRQKLTVLRHLPLAAICTLAILAMAVHTFHGIANNLWLALLGVPLVGLNLVNLAAGLMARNPWGLARLRERSPLWLAADIGTCALLSGALSVLLFNAASDSQRVVVVGVTASFIATGAWIFSGLRAAGLAWSIPFCATSALGVLLVQDGRFSELSGLIACFGAILCAIVAATSEVVRNNMLSTLKLERQNQFIGLLLKDFEEHSTDWLWETDGEGRLRNVSARLARMLKSSAELLEGRSWTRALLALAPLPGKIDRPLAGLAARLARGEPFRDHIVPVMIDGHRRWWSLTAKPLQEGGRVAGWRGVCSDVTAVRERDVELVRRANLDSLTGLANRNGFGARMATFFPADGNIAPCALVLIDLDNFKQVNDSLGHDAGDELLAEVGRRLKNQTRGDIVVGRLGGDEFALLVPGTEAEEAIRTLVQRVLADLGRPHLVNNHRIEMQASVGVAIAPQDARTPRELLKAADMALYEAKDAGRRTLRFFERRMADAADERHGMLVDLRQAIEHSQFVLHFQPQVDLIGGGISGFEALVRWRHPTRGLVQPARFVSLAEDSGLIVPLGRWVLEQACREAVRWPAGMRVAVNISAVEFERSDIRESVAAALRSSGLEAHRLEIELTESTLLQDTEAAVAVLRDLRRIGVRIALDDFGTGFSSLSYLRSFPLDKLKIDRSFVSILDHAGESANAWAIVQAIQGLAVALGLETTAEGVETAQQRLVLKTVGCHAGQGFLFAKPLTAEQTLEFIEDLQHQPGGNAAVPQNQWADTSIDESDFETIDDEPVTVFEALPSRDSTRASGARPRLQGGPVSRWAGL
jgi:diguanylate cyclase (GGDEF)-like protein/PAS domain S-box-containing protein